MPAPTGRALLGAARRLLLGVAALAFGAAVALSGCAREEPAPAQIRGFTEPTEAVYPEDPEQTDDAPAVGPLSADEQRELESQVRILSVGFAADGAYVMVNFKAPPLLAIHWQPGQLYVVSEATGVTYDDIPFMPKIGFLIARPAQDGQTGYVMLQNQPPLEPGSTVRVVLGGVREDGIVVEETNAPAP